MPKRGLLYQSTTKLPNCHKIYWSALKYSKMTRKYTYIFHSKALQNTYTQIGKVGMKINHLATLHWSGVGAMGGRCCKRPAAFHVYRGQPRGTVARHSHLNVGAGSHIDIGDETNLCFWCLVITKNLSCPLGIKTFFRWGPMKSEVLQRTAGLVILSVDTLHTYVDITYIHT
jgi:hypothetical protein